MKRLRVLAWIVLYAVVLRAFGSAVGIWAAGSLTVVATLLVGVVIPVWCFLFAPTWFGWGVVGPRPGGRLTGLVMAASWLSPLVRAGDLASIRLFLGAMSGRPLPAPAAARADAWTALAAVAQAERQGDRPRAERILDALAHLPLGSRFPWSARVYGVDALVGAALARGDWPAASRAARLGAGRLARLVELVGGAGSGHRAGRLAFWGAWLLAPMRRRTWRAVRRATGRAVSERSLIPPPADELSIDDARLRHLRLLDAADRAEAIRLADVFALADRWQRELDEAALARVRARALELGARDGEARARALRDGVLEELVELGAMAEGHPVSAPTATPLGRELGRRLRERLAARVDDAVEGLRTRDEPAAVDPLALWERWLVLREAVDVLDRFRNPRAGCWGDLPASQLRCDVPLGSEPPATRSLEPSSSSRHANHTGPSGFAGLWYGGVRDAVWSASCLLCEPELPRSPWAAHMMFSWIADRAEVLGDVGAVLANRENARRALTRR